MRADEFLLITRWTIPAPIEIVWQALHEVRAWPTWWKYVRQVRELDPGDAAGVGVRRRFVWGSRLPYRLVLDMYTTRVQRPFALAARASGDLEGVGRWRLRSAGDHTRVRYVWRVRLHRPWMRWLAPLLYPMFSWNHGCVMRAGERGLRRHLATSSNGWPERRLAAGVPRPRVRQDRA